MRRFAITCLLLGVAGCSSRVPLVAEYGPDRRFTLSGGEWLRNATLQAPENTQGRFSDLEEGHIVAVVPGQHEVLQFARKDEEIQLRVWVEIDGGRVVAAWLWAREWNGETAWYVGSGGTGTCRVDARDESEIEGGLELRFEGRREAPRSGISGPYVFGMKGDFSADAPKAK